MDSRTLNSYVYLIFLVSCLVFIFSSLLARVFISANSVQRTQVSLLYKKPWHYLLYRSFHLSIDPVMVKSIVHFVVDFLVSTKYNM